jgi:hypothetical protein
MTLAVNLDIKWMLTSQLQAPAAFPQGKIPIKYENIYPPETGWNFVSIKISRFCLDPKPESSSW